MSKDNDFRATGESLSVGNVVSAGLRIYRDHFKPYYLEALRSQGNRILVEWNQKRNLA